MPVASITPLVIVKLRTDIGRPSARATTPAAPSTSAGRVAYELAAQWKVAICPESSRTPRSAARPPGTAPRSVRSTTSGWSTATSASRSPPRAAEGVDDLALARQVEIGDGGSARTRRRARLANCRAAAGERPTIGAIETRGRRTGASPAA
jgi:hypothetical protein